VAERIAADESVYVVARPDEIRRLETAAGESTG
jgi:hypothetical protein